MTETKSKIHKIAYIFFWIGIICEFAVSFSGYLIGNYKEPLIIVVGMGCFAISILLNYDFKKLLGGDKELIKKLLIYIGMVLLATACYISQHSALVMRIVLVLIAGSLCAKKDKADLLRSVAKAFFWGTLAVMVMFAILSAMGFYNSFSMTQQFRSDIETRYCFGFFHPNGFSLFYLKILLLGFFLYSQRIRKLILPMILIIVAIPLILANSKMVLLCYIVAAMLIFVVRCFSKKDMTKYLWIFGILVIIAVAGLIFAAVIKEPNKEFNQIVTFGMHCGYKEPLIRDISIWERLDDLTSGRLSSMSASFRNYTIPLFGYGNVLTTTENGFVNSIFSEGIIFVLAFFGVVIWLLRKMYKNKDCYGMIVVIVTFMNLFSESFMPYFNKNAIWMMLLGYF